MIESILTLIPEAHDLKVHLISLSDGSAVNKSMSVGWDLSLPDGTRLATCSGPAQGSTQLSFRAEGYGMLSITRFLHHLFRFCSVDPAIKIQLSCDNDPLLKRLRSSCLYTSCFTSSTLEPDWDIVDSIVQTIQAMDTKMIIPITPTYP
jgi:hypothetical protein